MAQTVRSTVLLMLVWCLLQPAAYAQDTDFDASWYNPTATYVKVAVVQDGVYQITGADLAAVGLSTAGIPPATVTLRKNGREVPLWYEGDAGTLTPDAKFFFVGRRNRGDEEAWAYQDDSNRQGSTFFSLYTDTTFYWLSWNGPEGARYQNTSPTTITGPDVFAFRDTLHVEAEREYYDGDGTTNAENPFYTRGEGIYANRFRHTGTEPVDLPLSVTPPSFSREDSVYIRARLNSFTNTRHRFTLDVETVQDGDRARRLFDEADWTGYAFQTLRAAFPSSQVPEDNLIQAYLTSHNEFNAEPNQTYFDWVEFSYIREMVAQNGELRIVYPDAETRRLNLSGFGEDGVLVFSPADRRVFAITPQDGRVAFSDRPTDPPVYWATSRTAVRAPAALALDRSSDWNNPANEADYVIVTTPLLRASAEAMAAYRSAHNGFRVAVVEVGDVFDQFDYGRPTPLAIRRFVHQTQRWRTPPQYLLFWGDAIYAAQKRLEQISRPAWEVISYGKASSDGWFAMQYGGPDDWTEVLAVGRAPIRDHDTGLNFVQKLQNYEARSLGDWQKRMLMLVGGRGVNEQATLQSFVQPWSQRATAAPAGMDTLNFYRDSETAVDASFQDTLRLALRQGASWLSYFGHSAASTWEIVTDEPRDFGNAERLPLAISLGCRTGAFAGGSNLVSDTPVLAEKLVTESANGAIAHWGSSGLGGVGASRELGGLLHELVFTDTLRTIGKVFQEVKRRYATQGSFSLRDLVQFGLVGDPATRLDIPTRPDFRMTPDFIRITPEVPVPDDEALTVAVRLQDRGLVPADSITVHLTHSAPDGSESLYVLRIPPFRLTEDVLFSVPIDKADVGVNRFRVSIDPENAYAEVSETNNTAERTQVIFSTEVSLIAPLTMNAAGSTTPRLRVTYPLQDEDGATVFFELDTSPTFDSPDLRTFSTPAAGTFAAWDITDPLVSEQAYFWRARVETSDGLINWQEASFFVKEGLTGTAWIQGGRLFDDNTQDFRLRREDGRWVFSTYDVEVDFTSSGSGGQFRGQFVVDGQQFERLGLGFGMLIIDGANGAVRASGSMPTYQNQFEDPAAARAELESLVALLDEGDYVYVRTRHLGNANGEVVIPEDIKAIFRSLGSTAIDTLTYSDLWLMRTRVGSPEETREWVADNINEIIQKEVLTFSHGEGQTASPRIGPARAWERLEWQTDVPNAASEVRIDVLDDAGENVLFEDLTNTPADLSVIDAEAHPFLRLRATLIDSSQNATPQLTQWRVHYTAIAELALDASSFTVSADTVQEAQPLTASASIINLSDAWADTVVLTLNLTDFQNRTVLVATDTLRSLGPEETAAVTFSIDTNGLTGRNLLTLEAQQPGLTEAITYNNTVITDFRVQGDRAAPVLSVTVNGEAFPNDPDPILNRQSPDIPLIPPQPTFEIVFSDENPFKLLNDTTLAILRLDGVRIPFTSPDVSFEPATTADNEARILYSPDFTGVDNVYTLEVTAFDASGNEAEGSPYQFHFRVQSTFEIGSVYPYPNPMNTFTRFAFLLRGADLSLIDDFRIRIYTVTGVVIQEFDLVENPALIDGGQLSVGWNKVVWDGRDVDGDPVSTGVYLYKVYLKVDGESIEVNESPVEKIVVFQ